MAKLELTDPDPQPSNPLKVWLAGLIVAGLLTVGVISGAVLLAYYYILDRTRDTALTVPIFADEPVLNHIAFTGNDNNVWLVSPSGQNPRRLTEDGRGYRFPTWSPDGTQLAFLGQSDAASSVLYVSPTVRAAPAVVYREEKSSPFYLYWAPDSQAISFLTQESGGMAMRLVDLRQPENSRLLERGAPFYWVWSPKGDRLLMHVGGARSASQSAHLSFLDNRQNAQRQELDFAPGRFQAPAWTSNGETIFYVGDNGDNEAIFKTNINALEPEKITDLTGFAFMTMSPDDQSIAFLQFEPGTRPPFGRAYLVDTSGSNRQLIIDDLIASMYWSPDGTKLALLAISRVEDGSSAQLDKIDGLAAPLRQDIHLRWWIYEVADGTVEPLASFSPTAAFLQTVPFFDQYYLSLTFWSPDSRYFVLTKREDDRGNGSVWVYDTTGQQAARQVGDGRLAVWSWR
ncbi:MAG: PD40 domain-containing protein [Anaerolineae bacterium]|nr:PD40 domain-containing protein [Anaerolineae bacterium]